MSELAVQTPLVDAFGRTARDLRVSLTDRCNLRCTYCMPAEGMEWLPTDKVLSDAEVIRMVRIAVETLGIVKVRFTGGEPLLRKELEDIVAAASAMRTVDGGSPELMLTTNGLGLEHRAQALKDAGLDRVNISLDSLDPERYARLARRDRLHDVLAAIDASHAVGLTPVKVNSVIMRGQNEQDILPLADYCLRRGHQLRYIEQMPLGPHDQWDRSQMVTQTEILDTLREQYVLTPASTPRGAAPAELWEVAPDEQQAGGRIGVIASVTNPFCGSCDRTRLTADGQMRNCLFSRTETDLRGPLRAGASDEEIARLWLGGQFEKRAGHGIGEPTFQQPDRNMSAIGG
ncbi:GTP 3',8-cyclase MoaA [Tessaracoccus rhinocerotis]|uniref:GTP 3',8-cyclase MoaA n=1 Tax=Tessaracoccus rhinocerotis TaxID=1689449 RepID=UPI001C8F8401|nr:GTP 3',8-cyclase MoaA [Tessaracoccus rhinocerotis]